MAGQSKLQRVIKNDTTTRRPRDLFLHIPRYPTVQDLPPHHPSRSLSGPVSGFEVEVGDDEWFRLNEHLHSLNLPRWGFIEIFPPYDNRAAWPRAPWPHVHYTKWCRVSFCHEDFRCHGDYAVFSYGALLKNGDFVLPACNAHKADKNHSDCPHNGKIVPLLLPPHPSDANGEAVTQAMYDSLVARVSRGNGHDRAELEARLAESERRFAAAMRVAKELHCGMQGLEAAWEEGRSITAKDFYSDIVPGVGEAANELTDDMMFQEYNFNP